METEPEEGDQRAENEQKTAETSARRKTPRRKRGGQRRRAGGKSAQEAEFRGNSQSKPQETRGEAKKIPLSERGIQLNEYNTVWARDDPAETSDGQPAPQESNRQTASERAKSQKNRPKIPEKFASPPEKAAQEKRREKAIVPTTEKVPPEPPAPTREPPAENAGRRTKPEPKTNQAPQTSLANEEKPNAQNQRQISPGLQPFSYDMHPNDPPAEQKARETEARARYRRFFWEEPSVSSPLQSAAAHDRLPSVGGATQSSETSSKQTQAENEPHIKKDSTAQTSEQPAANGGAAEEEARKSQAASWEASQQPPPVPPPSLENLPKNSANLSSERQNVDAAIKNQEIPSVKARAEAMFQPDLSMPEAKHDEKEVESYDNSVPEEVAAEVGDEIVQLAKTIMIDGRTLAQAAREKHLDAKSVRNIVDGFLRGKDVKKLLEEEALEQEKRFERDPYMHHTPQAASVADDNASGKKSSEASLMPTLPSAPVRRSKSGKASDAAKGSFRAGTRQLGVGAKKSSARRPRRGGMAEVSSSQKAAIVAVIIIYGLILILLIF
jgi:hypothetical protein